MEPVWRFQSLTPWRCRLIFLVFLLAGFVSHLYYLHHCPIDLSGDEAHYWDWSRRLDWSYYSKGPLVAYLIRASCGVFGDTMPAVRYPALLLAAMTSGVTYLLTLRLFKSDRLALGVTLLNALVPMFIAGSLLMTIDPPFYFCWALATYLFTFAIRGNKVGPWIGIGVVIGIGFLAKYAALIWLPAALLYLLIDCESRPLLKTARPWVAVLVALSFTAPVLYWNSRHDWVSFRHVAKQTGIASQQLDYEPSPLRRKKAPPGFASRLGEFVGGQIGVLGPGIAALMVGGVWYAFSRRNRDDPHRRTLQMLAILGGTFFVLTLLVTFRSKVQPNWPAPAYFTLMILAGYFVSTRLAHRDAWRPWRGWVYGTILFGIVLQPIAHDFSLVYPLIAWMNRQREKPIAINKIDPTVKLRGWEELGAATSAALATLPPGAFVLCDDYQQTALLAFYTAGQPQTYCAGSYYRDAKRQTQYDLWPDRQLEPVLTSGETNPLLGRDAICIGKDGGLAADVLEAFGRAEPLAKVDVVVNGLLIRSFTPWRCYGFKGMSRHAKQY